MAGTQIPSVDWPRRTDPLTGDEDLLKQNPLGDETPEEERIPVSLLADYIIDQINTLTSITITLTDNLDGTYDIDNGISSINIDTSADSNPIADSGGYFTSTDVEGALQELAIQLNNIDDFTSVVTDNGDGTYTHDDGNGTVVTIDTRANSNPITDAGEYYSSTNVEGALQEIGLNLSNIDDFTSIMSDNGDGTYTHDDGNVTTTTIDTRANSNPYDNTVTGVLTGSTVQEAIDELSTKISEHIDGNILWVSSEGNNTTAEKGTMEKPYADPWTARDNATNGDLIYVLDGQWTFGPAASGADYEGTLDEINLLNGFTSGDTISYYFGENVILTKTGADYAGGPQGLFYTTEAIDVKVTGYLSVRWDSTSNQNSTIIYTNNSGANLYFELKEIKYKTFGVALHNVNSLTLKVNQVEPYSGSLSFFSFENQTAISNVSIHAEIDHYFSQEADTLGIVGSNFSGSEVLVNNSNISFCFNNVVKNDAILGSTDNIGYVFGLSHNSKWTNSNINIKCNNLRYLKSSGTITNPSGFYHTGDTQPAICVGSSLSNSKVNIEVNNCESDFPCVKIQGGSVAYSGDVTSYVKINGNFTCNDTYCIIMDSIGSLGNSPNKYITIEGVYLAKSKNVISDNRNANDLSPVIYKGIFKTEDSSSVVSAIRNTVTYDGARLINDSSVADTTTDNDTDLDIIVLNSYSNTLVTDSNIIEKVSPIVRDENINY